MAANLRGLTQVQRLLETAEAVSLMHRYPRAQVLSGLRRALDEVRHALRDGVQISSSQGEVLARAAALIEAATAPALRRVINATGVVLHTNLGRAPLAPEAVTAMAEAAQGYCNLELDLASGARGARGRGVECLLQTLTGAEAALAVNNAAAAVLLALSALARGGEVIVSRGELVEIGGGFRIPEVIAQGGARLVEVGTTNKTRLSDYADAITPQTRALLKVHQSNFRMVGFTEETSLEDLSTLARGRELLLIHDLGSGTLIERPGPGREPSVREALAAGADLVAFSGDKLMGGPQSGLLVGRSRALEPLRGHPLYRAVRLDKTILAALEATLRLYQDRDQALARVPVLRMLSQSEGQLESRARTLQAKLQDCYDARVDQTQAYAGGGASPQCAIPSRALTLGGESVTADELARRLRIGSPAVVARVADGRLVLDLFTLADEELEIVATALHAAIAL